MLLEPFVVHERAHMHALVEKTIDATRETDSQTAFECLICAIITEAEALSDLDHSALAAKVLAIGGYECAEGSNGSSERARLAIRLAAHLQEMDS